MSTSEAIEAHTDWVIETGQRWHVQLIDGEKRGPYVVTEVENAERLGPAALVTLHNPATDGYAHVTRHWMQRAPESGRTHWEREAS